VGHGCPAHGKYGRATEVFSACAAAALYSRAAWDEAGGFDETYFCYSEDVDLGFRLRLLGYGCLYVPDAVAHHVGSAIAGVHSDFAVYYGQRNLVATFIKNMPSFLFWVLLPYHLVLNVGSVVSFAFRRQGRVVLRAKVDALKRIPSAWQRRREIQARRRVTAIEIWRHLSRGWPAPGCE
jgi:GT2 family glycosyltransferase